MNPFRKVYLAMVATSVTVCLVELFHVWPFTTMKNCSIIKLLQSKFKLLTYTTKPQKLPKTLTKFCHTS